MSIWHCDIHGLYGGQTHCPRCGKAGSYVTRQSPEQKGGVKTDGKTEVNL